MAWVAAFGRYGPPAPPGEGAAARDMAAATNGGSNPPVSTGTAGRQQEPR